MLWFSGVNAEWVASSNFSSNIIFGINSLELLFKILFPCEILFTYGEDIFCYLGKFKELWRYSFALLRLLSFSMNYYWLLLLLF